MSIRLPGKIQLGAFGSRSAAPPGASPAQGRVPQPRPQILQRGPAQGREHFTTKDGGLDMQAVVRALNQLQANTDEASAQARANPMANGHLFQGVVLAGPRMSGTSAQAPNRSDAIVGQQYFDTTLVIPLFFNNSNWNTASGPVQYAAPAGSATYTIIEHGFGTPALGAIVTNVQGGSIGHPPQIVPAGDATDSVRVRLWVPISGSPVADVYLFY